MSEKKNKTKEISMGILQEEDFYSLNTQKTGSLFLNLNSQDTTDVEEKNNYHTIINYSNINEKNYFNNVVEEYTFERNNNIEYQKVIQKEIKIDYKEKDEEKYGYIGKKQNEQKFDWKQYKKLLDYILREKWLVFIIYAPFLISTASQALIPYMIGKLLKEVTKSGSDSNVKSTSLILLGLIFITCFFGFFRALYTNLLGSKVYMYLKRDIFNKFIGYDIAFFEKNKTGGLISRLSRDVQTVKALVSLNSNMLLRNFLLCIGNIIMLFVLSWKVTLSIIPLIPSYYFITQYYSFKSKQIEKKISDINAISSELAEEVFTGIMTVKSFGQEEYEKKRFEKLLEDEYAENKSQGMLSAIFFTVSNYFLSNIGILIVLWYGGYVVVNHQDDLSSGDLASFILYTTSLASNSSSISYGLGAIISATGALERIFELMQYDSSIKNDSGQEVVAIKGSVQFENISFNYPSNQVQVLNGINLSITPGECVAFVGTSGSGKSTIIKLIERFYDTSIGQVLIDDLNVKDIKISSLRKHIGLVSQEPMLFSGSIIDNIVYGVEKYTIEEVDRACAMAGVDEFLKDRTLFPKGYDTFVGEKGTKLSGGQKQRVAIARALIKHPQILIFDEATSALDAESEYLVQQSIDSLIQNRTMTIIVIAHRLSTIKNCSKIIMMQQGKIVESGTHAQLILNNGLYKALVERQLSHKI
ncbi:ABC-type multidrug transport system, ATPase and permease component (macronuclear) [Tetrahymena thermophila SB210]|uniref:ABC-type multidrug transport system, ATPase and permease component n=1 Tax=Tetrahymena thermophila (strain SB210) TaxID=312017 RepID=Q22UN4_TETTS|nr:ABC-type multidrug transport system, ATPase and permease component [Tetrahymena thermophila SB210]EAR88936.1 ABC-type multidrug transport system, ATPase and permease component [Tetrahymena thermophila SB210]|eukprot:XP_001009181.1 ABC-type multidrug transport system, ATPase and permease component [Tetrahymena thermophila SB210]